MKRCCTCKVELDVNLFSKNKNEKDGLDRKCRICQKKYYLDNRKKIIARVTASTDKSKKATYDKNRRSKKRDLLIAYDRARNSLPHRIQRSLKWAKDNRAARRAHSKKYAHKRRASLLQATPKWYGELDDFVLQEALSLCELRKHSTKIKWELDHYIPLMGKAVCGLHCWNNFQVVPKMYNRRKLNKFPYPEWNVGT